MLMKAIEVIGTVDELHRLSAQVPEEIPAGPVRIAVLVEGATEAARAGDEAAQWTAGIAREWAEDLADPRQDVYTLADGEPVDAGR